MKNSLSPATDLFNELKQRLGHGTQENLVRNDPVTRILYSTDASIYQVEPLGVVFPRHIDELQAIMEVCIRYQTPVLARGSGSSLAGQAIGPGLIIDCSRYLNRLVELDAEAKTAIVEPGLILNNLNKLAARHQLQFGPDPASAERASLGGSIANNATGAHSIRYGMTADHLISTEVVLSDGSIATLEDVSLERAIQIAQNGTSNNRLDAWYRSAVDIRQEYASAIQENWPRTWRCASGYTVNYLLPWSASQPPWWSESGLRPPEGYERLQYPPVQPERINLAKLLAGSEGTLAIIRQAKINLTDLQPHTILAVVAYASIAEACDDVPALLEYNPSAIELVPASLVVLARSLPAYAHQLKVLDPITSGDRLVEGGAYLVVEFAGADQEALLTQARQIGRNALIVQDASAQKQVWAVRKVGLGILQSKPGDMKPWAFIEDLSVPVDRLGEFIREMERILAEQGTRGEIYAHASAGCLHVRPIINLKTLQGVQALRSIAEQAVALVARLGGAATGEHGDGLARSEWLEPIFGAEIVQAFRLLKTAADPGNLMNPGKVISPIPGEAQPRMDQSLRFGSEYNSSLPWSPALDFELQGGLDGAIEHCNGAGVCRKSDGVMCPSFQASHEEMHSTRGRSNLLRAMISGRFPDSVQGARAVYEAMDLCLACKGCKAECPSGVDVAKLKYEFLNHYYQSHPRRLRDYLFGYIAQLAGLGHNFAALVNPFLTSPRLGKMRQAVLGLNIEHSLPALSQHSLKSQWKRQNKLSARDKVLFLSDAFTEFYQPDVGLAALRAVQMAGYQPVLLPVIGAGRTLISKGFLEPARQQAKRVVEAIDQADPTGALDIIGVEPSEIYTLRDEYLDLLNQDERVSGVAGRAWMIDEWLVRPGSDGEPRMMRIAEHRNNHTGEAHRPAGETGLPGSVMLHGHCYQKARPPAPDGYPVGAEATRAMLKALDYQVELIDAGCCGMAGSFGYEVEHAELSKKVAELALLPSLRKKLFNEEHHAPGDSITQIAAAGTSCRSQIDDLFASAHKKAVKHPVELL